MNKKKSQRRNKSFSFNQAARTKLMSRPSYNVLNNYLSRKKISPQPQEIVDFTECRADSLPEPSINIIECQNTPNARLDEAEGSSHSEQINKAQRIFTQEMQISIQPVNDSTDVTIRNSLLKSPEQSIKIPKEKNNLLPNDLSPDFRPLQPKEEIEDEMTMLPTRRRSFNIGAIRDQESEEELAQPKRSRSFATIADIGKQKGHRNLFALIEEEKKEEEEKRDVKAPSPNYFT